MDDLRARIGGAVLGPADAGYDRHRRVFDRRVDKRPALIVRCASAADVTAAVAYRGERELPLAVRSAGLAASATVDGGLLLDVAPLKAIAIDARARTARVGGGVTWAELDAAAQRHGLAVTGARLSRLGVTGVATGSGSGWLERSLGPAWAYIADAAVVLADGRSVAARDDPELLWALRGGGPPAGVVTELELGLAPIGEELLSGFLAFPRERARDVARAYRDHMADAPDAVGGALVLFAGRGGGCQIAFSHHGPVADGERALAPLRALAPSLDAVQPNEYRALQAMTDLQQPEGAHAELRSGLLAELSDAALDAALAAAERPASALSQLMLVPRGGALARADPSAAAGAGGAAPWAWRCLGLWPPVASLDAGNAAWVAGVAGALAPFAHRADDAGARDRLARATARLDPAGVFDAGPPARSPR